MRRCALAPAPWKGGRALGAAEYSTLTLLFHTKPQEDIRQEERVSVGLFETKPGELGQAFGLVCLELQGLQHLPSFAATETEQRQKRLAAAS